MLGLEQLTDENLCKTQVPRTWVQHRRHQELGRQRCVISGRNRCMENRDMHFTPPVFARAFLLLGIPSSLHFLARQPLSSSRKLAWPPTSTVRCRSSASVPRRWFSSLNRILFYPSHHTVMSGFLGCLIRGTASCPRTEPTPRYQVQAPVPGCGLFVHKSLSVVYSRSPRTFSVKCQIVNI